VRRNRFVGPATGNEPGVSGRSIDGIVDAEVTLAVEGNVFAERLYRIDAAVVGRSVQPIELRKRRHGTGALGPIRSRPRGRAS